MGSRISMDELQVRRRAAAAIDRIGETLATRLRARLALWVVLMLIATGLSTSESATVGRFGTRLAGIFLALVALELASAAVLWGWRRLRRSRRGGLR